MNAMAKSAADIADDIRKFMNKNSIDVWTMEWEEFYDLTERVRMKDAFQQLLQEEVHTRGLLLSYGRAAVIICRDYNFQPKKYR